ncbi:MAG: hypothetical protein AAF907_06855 [Planctomycetota bacterium]
MRDAENELPAIAPPDPADRPPRLRWRLIPAVGCGLIGGLFVLGGLLSVFLLITLPPDARLITERGLPQTAATFSGGLLGVISVPFWWRGRWGWAAGLTALGLSFFVAGAWLRP